MGLQWIPLTVSCQKVASHVCGERDMSLSSVWGIFFAVVTVLPFFLSDTLYILELNEESGRCKQVSFCPLLSVLS